MRGFQRRHGLEEDGVAGPATLAELNQQAEDHVRQIEVNLERWRWLPRDLGRRHVLVNIAAFRLEAVEDGRTELDMRVIVGKPYTRDADVQQRHDRRSPEPLLVRAAEHRHQRDLPQGPAEIPPTCAGGGYEVLSGGAAPPEAGAEQRSRPGQVPLPQPVQRLPARHAGPALFGRTVRTFSHGCIRVEKPLDLAVWALEEDPRWTPEAIRAGIDAGRERKVPLPRKIPVHVAYWTAWVDGGGTLQLGPDVYDRDAAARPPARGRAPGRLRAGGPTPRRGLPPAPLRPAHRSRRVSSSMARAG